MEKPCTLQISLRRYPGICIFMSTNGTFVVARLRAVFVRSTAMVVVMAAARTRHGKSVIVIGFVCKNAIDRSNKAIKNASANTKAEYTRSCGSHW